MYSDINVIDIKPPKLGFPLLEIPPHKFLEYAPFELKEAIQENYFDVIVEIFSHISINSIYSILVKKLKEYNIPDLILFRILLRICDLDHIDAFYDLKTNLLYGLLKGADVQSIANTVLVENNWGSIYVNHLYKMYQSMAPHLYKGITPHHQNTSYDKELLKAYVKDDRDLKQYTNVQKALADKVRNEVKSLPVINDDYALALWAVEKLFLHFDNMHIKERKVLLWFLEFKHINVAQTYPYILEISKRGGTSNYFTEIIHYAYEVLLQDNFEMPDYSTATKVAEVTDKDFASITDQQAESAVRKFFANKDLDDLELFTKACSMSASVKDEADTKRLSTNV